MSDESAASLAPGVFGMRSAGMQSALAHARRRGEEAGERGFMSVSRLSIGPRQSTRQQNMENMEDDASDMLTAYGLAHLVDVCRAQRVGVKALLALEEGDFGFLSDLYGDKVLLRKLIREQKAVITSTNLPEQEQTPRSEAPAPVVLPRNPVQHCAQQVASTSRADAEAGPSTAHAGGEKARSLPKKRAAGSGTASTASSTSKKLRHFEVTERIKDLDLEALLKADDRGGRDLLACYRVAQQEFDDGRLEDPPTLSDRQRNHLCHVIGEYLLSLEDNPSHKNYPVVTKKIKSLFRTETEEDYYIPPFKESTEQTHAKGKLPSAVKNIKSKRKLLGGSQPLRPSPASGSAKTTSNFQSIIELGDTPERQGAKTWLVHGRTPWVKVIDSWVLTAPHRFRSHFLSKGRFVNDYINSWPVLNHKSGHELLLEDFKLLYPSSPACLYDKWEIFTRRTLALARKEVKDKLAISYLNLVNESVDQNGVASIILHILPNIKPNHSFKKDSTRVKAFADQCRNSYLVTVKTQNDINRALRERRDDLASEDGGGQPLIVLVCTSPDEVQSAHVSVASLRYDVDSVLEAIDVFFKMFHSLHVPYPPKALIFGQCFNGVYTTLFNRSGTKT